MHSWGDKGLQWVAGEGSQKGRRGGGLPFHSGLTKTTRRRDGGNNGQHRGKSFRDRGRATVVALCGHAPHLSIRHPLNSHGHLQHRQPAIVPWTTAFIEIFCFASRDQRDLKTWLENWKKEWTLEGGMLGGGRVEGAGMKYQRLNVMQCRPCVANSFRVGTSNTVSVAKMKKKNPGRPNDLWAIRGNRMAEVHCLSFYEIVEKKVFGRTIAGPRFESGSLAYRMSAFSIKLLVS